MAKKADDDLQKHTLNLYKGDLEEVAAMLPDLKKTVVVREIVRDFIRKHQAAAPKLEPLIEEIEL